MRATNDAVLLLNLALFIALVVYVLRAARLHHLARRERYAAMQAHQEALWCHARALQGWHCWAEYAPPADMLVDVLMPCTDIPRILRAPADHVPALAVAWWRPFQPRVALSRIGGIA